MFESPGIQSRFNVIELYLQILGSLYTANIKHVLHCFNYQLCTCSCFCFQARQFILHKDLEYSELMRHVRD